MQKKQSSTRTTYGLRDGWCSLGRPPRLLLHFSPPDVISGGIREESQRWLGLGLEVTTLII
jgi:hypothetical protein